MRMKITLADALKISDKAWRADNDGKLSGVTRADIWTLIDAIRERDKEIARALRAAVSALYFQDSADYEEQLWSVVDAFHPLRAKTNEEVDEMIKNLYEEMNP